MAVTAGAAPWNRPKRSYLNKRGYKQLQQERSDSTPKNRKHYDSYAKLLETHYDKNYKKYARRVEHPQMHELRSIGTGEKYLVPDNDYAHVMEFMHTLHSGKPFPEEYTGYKAYYAQMTKDALSSLTPEDLSHVGPTESKMSDKYIRDRLLRTVQTPADFIDFVFDEKRKKQLTVQDCKAGHIARLEYNASYKLLKVYFRKRGDVCVFFELPANVAEQLIYLAQADTKATPSVTHQGHVRERHAVGVEFWNLVRVRGTMHNTRYQFQYTQGGPTGNKPGRREGTAAWFNPETGESESSDKTKWVVKEGVPSKYTYKKLSDKDIANHSYEENLTGDNAGRYTRYVNRRVLRDTLQDKDDDDFSSGNQQFDYDYDLEDQWYDYETGRGDDLANALFQTTEYDSIDAYNKYAKQFETGKYRSFKKDLDKLHRDIDNAVISGEDAHDAVIDFFSKIQAANLPVPLPGKDIIAMLDDAIEKY